jgi:hypothetical protein
MNNREEQKTVNQIKMWLSLKNILFWVHRNTGSIFRRRDGSAGFGRSLFHQKGVADLFIAHKGAIYAVEVKAPEGRLSKEQMTFLDRVHNEGGAFTIVARSLEDVMEALEPRSNLPGNQ